MNGIQMTTYCRYAHVDMDMIQDYWRDERVEGVDMLKIFRYTPDDVTELQKGWLKTREIEDPEYPSLFGRAEELYDLVVANLDVAMSTIVKPSDFYEAFDEDTGCYVVFAKCTDGIVGVAWSNEDCVIPIARLMACFVLYALGSLSCKADPCLGKATFRFLKRKVCSELDLAKADGLVTEYRIRKKRA